MGVPVLKHSTQLYLLLLWVPEVGSLGTLAHVPLSLELWANLVMRVFVIGFSFQVGVDSGFSLLILKVEV